MKSWAGERVKAGSLEDALVNVVSFAILEMSGCVDMSFSVEGLSLFIQVRHVSNCTITQSV